MTDMQVCRSMIDVIILDANRPYATVGQQHPGAVGFIQNKVLQCLGCLWFDRNETKDREIVARKIREHISKADNNPLLIFPEGTCVNNRYCVMFKRGAFDIGAKVYPIAIRYKFVPSLHHITPSISSQLHIKHT